MADKQVLVRYRDEPCHSLRENGVYAQVPVYTEKDSNTLPYSLVVSPIGRPSRSESHSNRDLHNVLTL
jgi:hypothetical protein